MTHEEIRSFIADRLVEIADVLDARRYRLTLVARCVDPEFAPPRNADIMVGDDEIDFICATLERLKKEGS